MTIGRSGIAAPGAKKGGSGLGPGPAAAADEGLYRRAGNLSLQGGEEWGLEPVGTLERRESSSGAGQGVMGVFHPQKLPGPG